MASLSSLPVLLPEEILYKGAEPHEWKSQRDTSKVQGPPPDDAKVQEMELAAAKQLIDGKMLKKTRPRRTVDYNAGLGRWDLLRRMRPNPSYVPHMRPAPPYIIDLLPPKAYPTNTSTSLCTKWVHSSTNKIRYPVNTVAWTPEGRRVLTGSSSGEFTLWNGLTFNFETILQAHDVAIRAMRFNHSGAYLASADDNGTIKYYQPNMNNLASWQAHREAIRGLSFSPDDGRFATASDDSTVRIWDFAESRQESTLTGHGWDVRCVEWHPTKGLLVSGSKDNLVKFWDPRTSTVLSTLHSHKNTVQAVSWSPNGNMMASCSRDQTVRVFDIRAMKEFRVLRGHKKEVCSIAWHPVHPILVTGGMEGSILHWDLGAPPTPSLSLSHPTSGPRATLSLAHESQVWALAFHPLGHLLVSASNDHTTRFWSRERPGDAGSVFSGGGEKPPEVVDMAGQEDDDDAMLPGFIMPGFASGPGQVPSAWPGKEEDGMGDGLPFGDGNAPYVNGHAGSDPDVMPGFSAPRQGGPPPPPHGSYGSILPPREERRDERERGGGHRQSRWGPARGGGRY